MSIALFLDRPLPRWAPVRRQVDTAETTDVPAAVTAAFAGVLGEPRAIAFDRDGMFTEAL